MSLLPSHRIARSYRGCNTPCSRGSVKNSPPGHLGLYFQPGVTNSYLPPFPPCYNYKNIHPHSTHPKCTPTLSTTQQQSLSNYTRGPQRGGGQKKGRRGGGKLSQTTNYQVARLSGSGVRGDGIDSSARPKPHATNYVYRLYTPMSSTVRDTPPLM